MSSRVLESLFRDMQLYKASPLENGTSWFTFVSYIIFSHLYISAYTQTQGNRRYKSVIIMLGTLHNGAQSNVSLVTCCLGSVQWMNMNRCVQKNFAEYWNCSLFDPLISDKSYKKTTMDHLVSSSTTKLFTIESKTKPGTKEPHSMN